MRAGTWHLGLPQSQSEVAPTWGCRGAPDGPLSGVSRRPSPGSRLGLRHCVSALSLGLRRSPWGHRAAG